jgi:hypothetical protein
MKAVVSIDRGENYHGSLLEEFYLVQDDPHDPELLVLWCADTGSQHDDDQARLYPVAWARYGDFREEDREDLSQAAAAGLLYAYIRAAAEAWDGFYHEESTVVGPDKCKTDLFAEVFMDALSGKPFRLPAQSMKRRGNRPR